MRNEGSYGVISSARKCDNIPIMYQQKTQRTALFHETLFVLPGTAHYVQEINVVLRT
jgi:hypothetical protein